MFPTQDGTLGVPSPVLGAEQGRQAMAQALPHAAQARLAAWEAQE